MSEFFALGMLLVLCGAPILGFLGCVLAVVTRRMLNFPDVPEEIGLQRRSDEIEEAHADLDGAGADDSGSKLV